MCCQFRPAAIFLTFYTCIFSVASAQASPLVPQVQELLDHAVTRDGPGVAVLIANGGRVAFSAARGRADIELGVALSPGQVFRIASVTKMFTAAMVLKLAGLGKLSIDDALSKYLPDFPGADQISLRQLLNHTSGVSDLVRDVQPGFSRRDVDTAALIAEIRKRPADFPPGSRWAYSNAGYILLGAVIEKVTGKSWHAAMQEDLFGATGLKRTRFGSHSALIAGRVAGYTTDAQTQRVDNAQFINSAAVSAAGGLVSDAVDLWHWMRALAEGRVIGRDGFRQMIAPTPDLPGVATAYGYGMGLYLWHVRGRTMIGHTGQINGFASFVGYLPARQATIVVLANDDNFDARTFGKRLAAIVLGEPFPVPVGVRVTDEIAQALQGAYRGSDGVVETLSIEDHRIYARRGNGKAIPLQMTSGHRLHFVPDELSYFSPVRNDAGEVVELDYFEGGEGPPQLLKRVSER